MALVVHVYDLHEATAGGFLLWGTKIWNGQLRTVAFLVQDFSPFFYCSCPEKLRTTGGTRARS